MLNRFAGTVSGPTLYKAYRVAIEPIALMYRISTIVLKTYNHLEFTAIKTSYKLPRNTSVAELSPYLELKRIANRTETRRNNFIQKNNPSVIIKHGETITYSQSRRIRVKTIHRDRSVQKNSWKTPLHIHKSHLFFSDMNKNYNSNIDSKIISIFRSLHPKNTQPTQPKRYTIQHIPTIKFNIKLAYAREELFSPSTLLQTPSSEEHRKQKEMPKPKPKKPCTEQTRYYHYPNFTLPLPQEINPAKETYLILDSNTSPATPLPFFPETEPTKLPFWGYLRVFSGSPCT